MAQFPRGISQFPGRKLITLDTSTLLLQEQIFTLDCNISAKIIFLEIIECLFYLHWILHCVLLYGVAFHTTLLLSKEFILKQMKRNNRPRFKKVTWSYYIHIILKLRFHRMMKQPFEDSDMERDRQHYLSGWEPCTLRSAICCKSASDIQYYFSPSQDSWAQESRSGKLSGASSYNPKRSTSKDFASYSQDFRLLWSGVTSGELQSKQ